MKRYDKSAIFKKAWNMVKNSKVSMSYALKEAWRHAKERAVDVVERMRIKDWFYDKNAQNFRFRNGSAAQTFEKSDIVKETEKAYNLALEVESYDGEHVLFVKYVWVPKSCVETVMI